MRLDLGTELDPGGIGKGLAADMLARFLLSHGATGALVSVGGDLHAEGLSPEGEGWVVAVADPHEPDRVVDTLTFERGAVASTWRTKRTWKRDGVTQHHVIDPRTGLPADTGVAGVTTVGGRGWQAEVLAKAALLAGAENAETILVGNHASGGPFADDGSVRDLGDIARYRARSC